MVPKYDSKNARHFNCTIAEIILIKPGEIFFAEIDTENNPPEYFLIRMFKLGLERRTSLSIFLKVGLQIPGNFLRNTR